MIDSISKPATLIAEKFSLNFKTFKLVFRQNVKFADRKSEKILITLV